MKLIYCPKCHDVVKLTYDIRNCECESSWGFYASNGIDAVYGGEAIPLGFANGTLAKAVRNQPDTGRGERFEAFIIPKSCPTMKKNDSLN